MENRITASFDGVSIAYSVTGAAETALVFVHGGMADRSFWDGQHAAFADRFQVIALDLAGHGESGRDRRQWGIPEFGCDVMAVMDAEHVERAVLVGNSLGGPVAIEAALLQPERALGVIGVDTFQSFQIPPAEHALKTAEAWRNDHEGSMDQMLRLLLHDDTDPGLRSDIRRRMMQTPVHVACSLFLSFSGYDMAASAARLQVPLRSVNGDKLPLDLAAVRRMVPHFEAIVVPHTGHYPMLEKPTEFNRALAQILDALGVTPSVRASKADSSAG